MIFLVILRVCIDPPLEKGSMSKRSCGAVHQLNSTSCVGRNSVGNNNAFDSLEFTWSLSLLNPSEEPYHLVYRDVWMFFYFYSICHAVP
jgi:hypothetical protein